MSTEDDNTSNNKRKPLIIAVVALAAIAFALGAFFGLQTSQESPSKLSPTTPKVPFVRSSTQSIPSAPPSAKPPPLAPPPTLQNNSSGQQNEDRD